MKTRIILDICIHVKRASRLQPHLLYNDTDIKLLGWKCPGNLFADIVYAIVTVEKINTIYNIVILLLFPIYYLDIQDSFSMVIFNVFFLVRSAAGPPRR